MPVSRLRLPVLDWMPRYRRSDLRRDLLAGLLATLGTAPEAMAFAMLAGLPPQVGLYALLLPLIVYFLLGSSRELSLAPTAPLAALVGVTVAPLAGGDPARHLAASLAMTWLLGAILVGASLLRLGFLASLVSRPVLNGYLAGAAVLVAVSQIGAMAGVHAEGLTLPDIIEAAAAGGEVHLPSLALGLSLLALLYAVHVLRVRAVGPALAVIAGTLAVAGLGLETPVVGTIPAGLPPLALPPIDAGSGGRLVAGALAAAALVFFDSTSLARHFAARRGYRVDADQEQLALGASNLAAGLTGAAPVSGNLADTLVLEEARARTPVSGIVTVAIVALLVLVGADLRNVPLAAFAAIVIHGVLRQLHAPDVRRTWRFDRLEVGLAVVAFAGVLGLGLMRGLLAAVVLTVLVLLARVSRPAVRELGLVEEPAALVDRERIPAARPPPGALAFQPVGALFFATAAAVTDHIRARVQDGPAGLDLVVLDLRVTPFIDVTACDELEELRRDLVGRGVRLLVARPNPAVEEKLRRYGLTRDVQLAGDIAALARALHLPREVRDLT